MINKYLSSLYSLENKVAVITGAAGYFGKAFAESLLSAGAKVILFARGKKVEALSDRLKKKFGGKKVEFYDVDFYDDVLYRESLLAAAGNNKTIDILINNAFEFSKETGFNDSSGRIENMSKKQWMRSLESGVYWHALSTQVIGEKMKRRKAGSIVNISSMYAVVSPDPNLYEGTDVLNPPSYGAAKAAILAFTRYSASFYGQYNVRCNALLPGSFPNTDPNAYNSPNNKNFMKRISDRTVLGRAGTLDDLQGALIFLASDASSYITGQTIVVDGGWTIR